MISCTSSFPSRGWTLAQWRHAYIEQNADASELLTQLLAALAAGDAAWIAKASAEQLAQQLQTLEALLQAAGGDRSRLPLYGVPFAVKDNIDAAGWMTTAACPAFAYLARQDAFAVARLKAAGAILVGKTNLDQFATGLVGTRSPFGVVPNSFDPAYISGGSSSGSASVVARGLVPFALGTDTAGSGRVPAAFNNIVGFKPTKGWVGNTGLVPACRTLDCISTFALTVEDAALVMRSMAGYDAADGYARQRPVTAPVRFPAVPRLAVPDHLEFFGDEQARSNFAEARQQLQQMGAVLEEIDFSPFAELAGLLYQGPWVAERFVTVAALLAQEPSALDPVVAGIVGQAGNYSAADAFRAEYRRADLARRIQDSLAGFDALVVPSTPSIYTIEQLCQEPVRRNSELGIYTNFTNLADLSALALPAGLRQDGLPAGITLIAPAWHDWALADFGRRWQAQAGVLPGAPGVVAQPVPRPDSPAAWLEDEGEIILAVVGAHLRGMPLNHQLTSRQARFLEETQTAAGDYRLYALPGTVPPKPGLKYAPGQGDAIVLELWALTPHAFGEFVAEVPQPLGIGNVMLADGRVVKGFICEPAALDGATDITAFGGWRAYLQSC
ncbi:allophanate hydrolase [Kerstersia gyiorum]|uniref:Allophanate hydrolase n=1 Tax=Kerstersia gyiorum TaxID=206506 RepID=A0A171KVF3_9BURK|nr:allophanate hydrolase [Kerstersia gyiorum]KKO72870.1 allophanate hydrolase [Kerstersia gyiorum]